MAGGTASGAFTSGSLSSGAGASLWLISALLPTQHKVTDDAVTRLFVWMPEQLAHSKEEAVDLLIDKYVQAVKQALPDHEIMKIDSSVANGGLGGISLKVVGQKCTDGCIQTLFYVKEPELGTSPDIMGGYDAYVWNIKEKGKKSNFIPQGKKYFPLSAENLSREERVDFYQNLSSGLPEWVYLYIAPNAKASPIPVIYNKGLPNYFITPNKNQN
jgi:hypothetical protein